MSFVEEIALRQILRFGLLALGLAAALIYGGFFCHRGPSRLKTLTKTIPMPAFAAALWISFGYPLVVTALLLSAIGDIALSRNGRSAFLIGLIGFAAAHVLYIVHFLSLSAGVANLQWLAIVAVLLFALSTEFWLAPHTGDLRWPVRLYVLLIAGMGLSALGLDAMPLALIGAFAFMASDMVLSVQLFRMSDASKWQRPASVTLWLLYVGAQFAILAGAGWPKPLF